MASDPVIPPVRAQVLIPSTYPVQPGTFQSILPQVDTLLQLIYAQSISPTHVTPTDAIDSIAIQARELAKTLEGMKRAAIDLPGGSLSVKRIGELSRVLDKEGEKRRAILDQFGELKMGTVDMFAEQGGMAGEEVEDGLLSKESD